MYDFHTFYGFEIDIWFVENSAPEILFFQNTAWFTT